MNDREAVYKGGDDQNNSFHSPDSLANLHASDLRWCMGSHVAREAAPLHGFVVDTNCLDGDLSDELD